MKPRLKASSVKMLKEDLKLGPPPKKKRPSNGNPEAPNTMASLGDLVTKNSTAVAAGLGYVAGGVLGARLAAAGVHYFLGNQKFSKKGGDTPTPSENNPNQPSLLGKVKNYSKRRPVITALAATGAALGAATISPGLLLTPAIIAGVTRYVKNQQGKIEDATSNPSSQASPAITQRKTKQKQTASPKPGAFGGTMVKRAKTTGVHRSNAQRRVSESYSPAEPAFFSPSPGIPMGYLQDGSAVPTRKKGRKKHKRRVRHGDGPHVRGRGVDGSPPIAGFDNSYTITDPQGSTGMTALK